MNNIELMKYWLNSSEEDYNVMKYLYEGKKNSYCLFFGHLVIEKLLKGLYAKNNLENPNSPRIHNLITLIDKAKLEIPEELKCKIKVINTFNISARYDDYKETFNKKCTDEYTTKQVKNIEEVRIWLKEQLNKKY